MRQDIRRLVLVMGVSFLGFLAMLVAVMTGVVGPLDVWVETHVQVLWTPAVTFVMDLVTTVGRPLVLGGIAVALGLLLMLFRRSYDAIPALLGVAGGAFLVLPIKEVVHRLRPEMRLTTVSGFSFPSDHATVAVLFFGLLLVLLLPVSSSRLVRWVLWGCSLFGCVLISFTRIYLGVHWFSDVLGGWLLGLAWLCFTILLKDFLEAQWRNRKKI